ncbi:dihydrodipicolinate reductase C-terminal domain-containing protein [Fundidesulfovibrio terrae]|uniref:dihydrodipicolinate reductase C-terminal domain-containing protein n=1 Tax=Fundidesulfovibrio terrae TaxID=2922866 RepID=UPI001FAF647F|nr:dihydrodipicolinate reductase C-terminal domain-containing protein [Fundidesulfovibrio terrae]
MIVVAGAGKLAVELLDALPGMISAKVIAWADAAMAKGPCVVVHAGSGRELDSIVSYCNKTASTLIELATGSLIASHATNFPVVVCPNTNILMLKFMAMLATSGHHFKDYNIKVVESHQADKSSVPGTAVSIASSLGLPSDKIQSVRDPREQSDAFGIPSEYLSRHAYHRIEIEDPVCKISFETKVFGRSPYAAGVAQIICAARSNALENRHYDIMGFIEKGWL